MAKTARKSSTKKTAAADAPAEKIGPLSGTVTGKSKVAFDKTLFDVKGEGFTAVITAVSETAFEVGQELTIE